jgi:hypothetical protein
MTSISKKRNISATATQETKVEAEEQVIYVVIRDRNPTHSEPVVIGAYTDIEEAQKAAHAAAMIKLKGGRTLLISVDICATKLHVK